MKLYRYKPAWRLKDNDESQKWVSVYANPDPDWFETVVTRVPDDGTQFVRFVLMANGELLFGDGWFVLHHDICQCRGEDGAGPLLVGMISRRPKHGNRWWVDNVQWFLGMVPAERAMKDAQSLLDKLPEWHEACWAMMGRPVEPYNLWEPWTP